MSDRPEPTEASSQTDPEYEAYAKDPLYRAWMADHITELRQSLYDQRLLYQALIIGFAIGVAAHVVGYVLKTARPGEPFGLLADLLYTLGLALWTGIVVVGFVQVLPEWKRRQIKQAVEAYDAATSDEPKPRTRRLRIRR